jgi:hypothetical protein
MVTAGSKGVGAIVAERVGLNSTTAEVGWIDALIAPGFVPRNKSRGAPLARHDETRSGAYEEENRREQSKDQRHRHQSNRPPLWAKIAYQAPNIGKKRAACEVLFRLLSAAQL